MAQAFSSLNLDLDLAKAKKGIWEKE